MEAYRKMIWGSVVVAIVLLLPLIYYFFFMAEPEVPKPITPGAEPAKRSEPAKAPPREVLPPEIEPLKVELNESDNVLRELLKECSSAPGFPVWLADGDILRRFTGVVQNIAEGGSPAPLLQFMMPKKKFKVRLKGDQKYLDAASYKRYDGITGVFISLDTKRLVEIYRRLDPLIREAYGELGVSEGGEKFEQRLMQAFEMVLQTPVPPGAILLEEKVKGYNFSDSALEGLPDIQKHLLRMGPENVARIKAKIREFKEALTQAPPQSQ
ncbi:MAG: DUF3014 domain-containing protein [bacterium]|nr:DUF3014 domain-containing protein [bacterium]